jgi:hypothetical protein
MRQIEQLLIVAGPTASGKSTIVEKMATPALSRLATRIGLSDIESWPRMVAHHYAALDDLKLDRLLVHYDFVWRPPDSSIERPGGNGALTLLEGVREVTLVTLWTPPERLERQLIAGKLRAALPRTPMLILKAGFFRFLPGFVLRRLAATAALQRVCGRAPERLLSHHLRLLAIYSSAESVAALYRRWFEFCDLHVPQARRHLIVEFDNKLKFYSRDEWEHRATSGGRTT